MKRRLALLGAEPSFSEPLHVGRPNVGDAAAMTKRLGEIFERRWFTNDGPLVREFEEQIVKFVGVKHCVSMCNATVALEIAIRALGLQGEVIVPSYTFIATAHALSWQQITPIFADIDPGTQNLDPHSVEQLITPRTSGIIGVHLWGRACNIEALDAIAKQNGLKVIYDAAHAFGCSHGGKLIGRFGDCEVFSFHATKFLNSFEGGAVVTDNDDLADKMRLMRNFGFAGYDRVVYVGTNGKLTEICAAMGLTSIENIDNLVAVNERNHRAYDEALRGASGVSILEYDRNELNNFQYVVIQVDEHASLTRDELVSVLHAENILARKYFWPGCHRMEPYRSSQSHAARQLPETERISGQVVVLPTGQTVTADTIGTVCGIIRTAFEHAAEVRAAMRV